MLRAKVDEAPPALPASVPNAVAELISRALQPDPAERSASAAELRDALARCDRGGWLMVGDGPCDRGGGS